MWVLCSQAGYVLPASPQLTYYQSDIFNVCRCVTFGIIKLSNGHGVRLCVARLMCDMSALLVRGLTRLSYFDLVGVSPDRLTPI